MPSTDETIHAAVLATVRAGMVSVSIDGRRPQVQDRMPESGFTQKQMPLVVVFFPMESSNERFDSVSDREEYTMDIQIFDEYRPSSDGEHQGKQRLAELRKALRRVLNDSPTLGLASMAVLSPFWELRQSASEYASTGNNLMIMELQLTVPVIVERLG